MEMNTLNLQVVSFGTIGGNVQDPIPSLFNIDGETLTINGIGTSVPSQFREGDIIQIDLTDE
jgi:hypothetical protein